MLWQRIGQFQLKAIHTQTHYQYTMRQFAQNRPWTNAPPSLTRFTQHGCMQCHMKQQRFSNNESFKPGLMFGRPKLSRLHIGKWITADILRVQDSIRMQNYTHHLPVRWYCTEQDKGGNAEPFSLETNNLGLDELKPVRAAEIKSFLQQQQLSFQEGYACFTTTCPRFSKKKLAFKEMNRLFVNKTTGYFVCLSCKKSGSWSNFVDNTKSLMSSIAHKNIRLTTCFKDIELEDGDVELAQLTEQYNKYLQLTSVANEDLENLLAELNMEVLQPQTLMQYGVRVNEQCSTLAVPMFGVNGGINGIKFITLQTVHTKDREQTKIVSRTIPRIELNGLFGWNLVTQGHVEVVLTANELDAMAVRQELQIPALALPKGDSKLPQKVLPLLEQFKKIILWFGGDMKNWGSAKQFARKLSETRCSLIRPDDRHPGAMAGLQRGLNLKAILQAAKPVQHKSIISFRNLRHDVFLELMQAEAVAGVKWKRYPQLNKLLKGHRRGELTLITGPTGSGKTTFISDYSLDLCTQGVNTLWGSFEINNIRLIKTMLTQYSQVNLIKQLDQFDHWADKFEQLPMYFMTFHGQENIRKVIETMSHAVYIHDIAHVIVDNLQFMMGTDDIMLKQASERYLKQDQIISAFRKFATTMNCHVTLVIHPRKERETDELTISSIFGSAKASQEADNVLILQDRRLVSLRGRKYIQVAKNRYDGELGIMLLKFDKDTLSYSGKDKSDVKDKPKEQAPAPEPESQDPAT